MAGTKHNIGKPMMDTIPPGTLFEVAEIFTLGAEKYNKYNWAEGIPYSDLYAALQRHLNKFWLGRDIDPEWNKRHLAHAMCELIMLMNTPEEYDDRFWKGKEIPEYIKEIIQK